MSSRLGSSPSENGVRIRKAMSRGAGKPFMSEKQIEAYLMARDSLRAIRQASSVAPRGKGPDFLGGPSRSHC